MVFTYAKLVTTLSFCISTLTGSDDHILFGGNGQQGKGSGSLVTLYTLFTTLVLKK